MAFTFLLNQVPADFPDMHYRIKEWMVTLGWTVLSSGTGTAGSYNASGDSIASGTMGTARSWYRIKNSVSNDELIVQHIATATARIKYSHSAGFVGGAPNANTVPSATDELLFHGGGSDASPTGTACFGSTVAAHLQLIGDASTGSFIVIGNHASPTANFGLPSTGWFYDRLLPPTGESHVDPSPMVFGCHGAVDAWLLASLSVVTGSSRISGRLPDGSVGSMPMMRYGDSAVRTPGGQANLHSGRDVTFPIFYGREGNFVGCGGLKGRSSLFRWMGRINDLYGTFVSVYSEKDHIVVGNVLVPWDGSTVPTDCASDVVNSDLNDRVRGCILVQDTAASQPTRTAGPNSTVARLFDGTDDDAVAFNTGTTADTAVLTGQWTVEAFVRPDAIGAVMTMINFSGIVSLETLATNNLLAFKILDTGKLGMSWEYSTGTDVDLAVTAGSALSVGTWYHVAAVKNGSEVRFFVDGTMVEAVAYANAGAGGTSSKWVIGRTNDHTDYFNGAMRSVRISSVARSDGAIAASAALLATTVSHTIDENTHALWQLGGTETLETINFTDSFPVNVGGNFVVAGEWTGYSGDGSGIVVTVHDKELGRIVATTTTAVGGTYSVNVTNGSRLHFAEARQDGTKLGRTDDDYPAPA